MKRLLCLVTGLGLLLASGAFAADAVKLEQLMLAA